MNLIDKICTWIFGPPIYREPEASYKMEAKPVSQDTIPTVTITRETSDEEGTFGTLRYGTFVCKTLEKPWRDNKKQVSCIPKGTYITSWQHSPKHGMCYELESVPNRGDIQIHVANWEFELLGCIALGTTTGKGSKVAGGKETKQVIGSTKAVKKFNDLMATRSFYLVIGGIVG